MKVARCNSETRGLGQLAVILLTVVGAAGGTVVAQDIARITLMVGTPRLGGEVTQPFEVVSSDLLLETGDQDAVGIHSNDVVVHVGENSTVKIDDQPDHLSVELQEGFVAVYFDPRGRRSVTVTTPFGVLAAPSDAGFAAVSGLYAVRHDVRRLAAGPAVSTFSGINGEAKVRGIVPKVGPYQLHAGQQWRVTSGVTPGPPEAVDSQSAIDALAAMLHRGTTELVRAETGDDERIEAMALPMREVDLQLVRSISTQVTQILLDANDAVVISETSPRDVVRPETRRAEERIRDARPIQTRIVTSLADFVSYPGPTSNPDWEDSLVSADGEPAFLPRYIDELHNGGFSYLQLAGADARLETDEEYGEVFYVGDANAGTGWAVFTPQTAVADRGFEHGESAALAVITEGFRAIALGEHLGPEGARGAIGGNGEDASSAFVLAVDGHAQFNPTPPVGYPLLSRASDIDVLRQETDPFADELAALGAGLDPRDLDSPGEHPQLLFVSDRDTGALDFRGELLGIVDLMLPGDLAEQEITIDRIMGFPSLGTPLSSDSSADVSPSAQGTTVGIQFRPGGDDIAIIHHTGLRSLPSGTLQVSAHFEIERGTRYTIVRWREATRPTNGSGEPIDFEDLNGRPDLRNELFVAICREVNRLVPSGTQTACGPAVSPEAGTDGARLRSASTRLSRSVNVVRRRAVDVRRSLARPAGLAKARVLQPARGRLLQATLTAPARRHVRRVTGRR